MSSVLVLPKRALDALEGEDFGMRRRRALDALEGEDFGMKRKRALDALEGSGFGLKKRALDMLEGEWGLECVEQEVLLYAMLICL